MLSANTNTPVSMSLSRNAVTAPSVRLDRYYPGTDDTKDIQVKCHQSDGAMHPSSALSAAKFAQGLEIPRLLAGTARFEALINLAFS